MNSFLTANNEKLTEKAFSSGIITSVLSIVLCIAALCSTSWAWFTGSTASNENTIKTAENFTLEFYLNDSVMNDGEVELQAGQVYTVKISLPKDSASGYLVMTSNGVSYRSDYIQSHENDTAESITFFIEVEETQKVTFTKRWGIYTGDPSVEAGETLTITTKN